jgi:hypothetical protein
MEKPMSDDLQWWWLSFVDTDTNSLLGACLVQAYDVVTAAKAAWDNGCNPGGQVAAWRMPSPDIEDESDSPLNVYGPNRLITPYELEANGETKIKDLDPELQRALGFTE